MTWKIIRVDDLGRVVTGDTPPKKIPEYYGSAYPFIKPTDMKIGHRYTYYHEDSYSEKAYEKYRKKLIPENSTAVVTIGSIGQKLTLTHKPCFVNQAVNVVIPDPSKFNPFYVFYLLRYNLHLVKKADTGASSGRENVSKSNFSGLELLATLDVHEQGRIAAVLDSYDSLIENNRRRISLLEEAARLLYREWFVSLRFPGHESVQIVSAGLPHGWSRSTLGDQTTFLNRGIAPKYDDSAVGFVVNQKCIRGGMLNMEPARKQSKEVKPDRLLQVGDVLINSTGAGTLGRVALVRSPLPNCTVDTHVTIVRPLDSSRAAYLGLALLELESMLSTMGIGATNQLELGRADIAALPLIEPPVTLQQDFHDLVWAMLRQADTLAKMVVGLADARDQLLPKIISGEIKV